MTHIDASSHVRHGPARHRQGGPGFINNDNVPAFPCQSYPLQARQWLDQHREMYWPTNDMIQYCSNFGCFVVGVGQKGSVNEELEWRISTSFAERCLMFNLNITQIRCYVLMKMILRNFITTQYPESISSFMCKTVLLHCVSNTRSDEWQESTLITCLTFCLSTLYKCVLNEYCPHFIIAENNLMMRRFSQGIKPLILEALYYVIESNGRVLLEIQCDNLGVRLLCRLYGNIRKILNISHIISGQLCCDTAFVLNICVRRINCILKNRSHRNTVRLISYFMSKFINVRHTQFNYASRLLIAQSVCHTMGTILASVDIKRKANLSYQALSFLSLGLGSDAASGKLKLASVLYCTGYIEKTEVILKIIEESYDKSVVEPICKCYDFRQTRRREIFCRLCYNSNKEHTIIKNITASCVRFLRCEANCCPHELQHEMFRSTQEDLPYRHNLDVTWMDMAVVDSLPFLYFLQYKIYSRLGKEDERNIALSKLARTIDKETNLGHRETALNLLGQSMENENRTEQAFKCYMLSLILRSRNNAAKFLMCRLYRRVGYRR